ncbi:hypothetical protein O9Z70_14380 [Devosia sp. YIM 151766]|uniref:hypothetical protein n=1 Tax=Devosia sp. YIM 151766 TaxID=3017325 RepID=UPI00255C5B34|nr:hypothetical protein [Devosia sp. YIM 151766]WIY52624.1 hypothetical protein O9Z70_14380 [Devosia sp. YIM 151766]
MDMMNRNLGRAALALALMAALAVPVLAQADAEIDFGDDSSEWANDGECDDPRFAGAGMAVTLLDSDRLADASDCRAAFEAGAITLADETAAIGDAIDFGDDSGEWANDQECDDPRFAGPGMAGTLDDDNIGRDATDCRNAFADGTIALGDGSDGAPGDGNPATAWLTLLADRVDFGDDSGDWPHDGECDDPDFSGRGATAQPYDDNRLADASDCRAAFIAGTVVLRSAGIASGAFDYGNDQSRWAHDGECDDPRFAGPGMAKKLDADDIAADASDCRMLEAAGDIAIKPVYRPDYAQAAPYDGSAVDFGDDSSPYADNDVCDDPRFEGPGAAITLLESDRSADASDCRAAFEAGTIALREGES